MGADSHSRVGSSSPGPRHLLPASKRGDAIMYLLAGILSLVLFQLAAACGMDRFMSEVFSTGLGGSGTLTTLSRTSALAARSMNSSTRLTSRLCSPYT